MVYQLIQLQFLGAEETLGFPDAQCTKNNCVGTLTDLAAVDSLRNALVKAMQSDEAATSNIFVSDTVVKQALDATGYL